MWEALLRSMTISISRRASSSLIILLRAAVRIIGRGPFSVIARVSTISI